MKGTHRYFDVTSDKSEDNKSSVYWTRHVECRYFFKCSKCNQQTKPKINSNNLPLFTGFYRSVMVVKFHFEIGIDVNCVLDSVLIHLKSWSHVYFKPQYAIYSVKKTSVFLTENYANNYLVQVNQHTNLKIDSA